MFKLFTDAAPNRVFMSILLGAIAGISYSMLIPLIMKSLKQDAPYAKVESTVFQWSWFEVSNYKFAALFVVICLVILITRTISQVTLARVSLNVTSKLRRSIYKAVSSAPLSTLERVGASRLIAAVTADVQRVSMGARMLPDLLINLVTLVGMLGFLLYLNPDVFTFVMMCIAFGIVTYQLPVFYSKRFFVRSRKHLDQLQEAIRGLIYGAKELKLNERKRQSFYDEVLIHHENRVIEDDKTGMTIIQAAANYGSLISFFAIGAVSFMFVNYHSIEKAELIGVIMALLYVSAPVAALLNFIPQYSVALVSYKRIKQLFHELECEQYNTDFKPVPEWNQIEFRDVSYQYKGKDGNEGFKVGPLNFTVKRGEITFIIGGNGSGKSTLSKLLTLHYPVQQGGIYYDDVHLDQQVINDYRQEVSAIYSDYYLFDRILDDSDAQETRALIDQYLKDFGIEDKVKYENGRFSTLALSDGQKRRLALLVSFIDNKNFYLFDEWAADQDPLFKEVFYHKILPEMKAKGKAIVVISHDDRYFSIADKVMVMEEGKMISQKSIGDAEQE